jgi:hypothetical protein
VPGHPGRERPRRELSRLHRRSGRKLTRLLARVAGRHTARDSRPVKPGRTLPAGTADHGNLTRAGEATAVVAAVERPWSLRPWSLRSWSLGARALRPRSLRARSLRSWKLSGKLLSGKLLSGKLRRRKLRRRKLRRRELGRWPERPRVWLFGERCAAWTSGAGLGRAGLSWAHLAVAGKPSCGVLADAVRSSFVPGAAARPYAGGRSRIRRARLLTAGPPAAVLLAAVLPTDLRRAALRPPGKLARGLGRRLLGRVRPGGWRELGTTRDRALRPGTGSRRGLPAGSVAIRATVARSRSPGRLASETGPARESAGRGPGTAGRDRSAAHAVITRTPAKPRTPIPRTLVPRQTGIASRAGAPPGPGVGISPAFVIRPVFGARPPTPAPPPREPCHIIDRRHPGDR